MVSNIQLKGRFTHGRAGSNQNQVGRLHSRRTVIKIQKSRRNPRDAALILRGKLNLVHGVHDDLANGDISIRAAPLYQLENTLFRILQYVFQRFLAAVAGIGNLFIQSDQLPQYGLFRYYFNILLNVGGGNWRGENFPDKFQTADLRWYLLHAQALLQRDQIHRTSAVV